MIYRETSTKIYTNIIDPKAKTYCEITADTQPFTSQDLTYGLLSTIMYMTNELNISILDGSLSEIDIQNDLSYVSSTMSKSDATFNDGEEPTILIEFWDRSDPDNPIKKTATSQGITLNFSDGYLPNNINIKYYDINNAELVNDDFVVFEINSVCDHGSVIPNYHKILITFTSTKYPNSFVKVNNIEYGIVYNWSSDTIGTTSSLLNAKIIEETDPLSNTLPINTCEFTVYDEREDFNIVNPNNIYDNIQQNQRVLVYETIRLYDDNVLQNESEIFMGTFYIKEWKSNAEHEITFKCVDLIGILDDTQFYIGKQYDPNHDTVESVITSIFSCVKSVSIDVSIDNSIKTDPLKGFLPLCSCREALQQVLFCIGAVADCSRDDKIKIFKQDNTIKHTISDTNNLEYEQIQKNDVVSDVYIYVCYLDNGNDNVKIFDGTLAKGRYNIKFNELIRYVEEQGTYVSPKVYDGDSSALILYYDSQGNVLKYLSYFELLVKATTYITILANTYSISNFLLDSAHNKNTKIQKEIRCKNNYFLNNFKLLNEQFNYATDTANRLLEYYSTPNTLETEIILDSYFNSFSGSYFSEQTGDWCLIKNKYGDQIIGKISRMEIDLTGGFLSKTKFVCVTQDESACNYVCSNFYNSSTETSELYSGDNIGLL